VDGGDHNHRNFWIVLAEPFKELDAVHFRHDHVAEDQIGGGALDNILRRPTVTDRRAVITLGLEHGGNDFANGFFVVDHQNVFDAIRLHVATLRTPVYERSQTAGGTLVHSENSMLASKKSRFAQL
jgi:hypothetical protein